MTNTATIDVNSATRDQLLTFAREELGLNPPGNVSKDAIKQLVSKQLGQDVRAGGQDDAAVIITRNQALLRKEPKRYIRIAENEKHPKMIPVSVNGVDFGIKQGAKVAVPVSVVEALRNAVQARYRQVAKADGKGFETIETNEPQFAFEDLGPAPNDAKSPVINSAAAPARAAA